MKLDEILDALIDSCDRRNIVKEDVKISIFYNDLLILQFNLDLVYRVIIYLSENFCNSLVKNYEMIDFDTINIYL